MSTPNDIRPLIPESSTSESTNVAVVMGDLERNRLIIPDYQRDSDQWSDSTKSLLIESVINNLSIPAFFFEVKLVDGVEQNEVVDGQQRLTTLSEFYKNRFALVTSDDAPYLSPNSVHYAGKTFQQLPQAYADAFQSYRLTIIKLRQLNQMRLEVFRRINQGGTPLSGQDIRLAYYSNRCPSLAFVRLAGIYDDQTPAAGRFLTSAGELYGLSYPWTDRNALETWRAWWEDKIISRGQTASECFLWSLVVAQVVALEAILQNRATLSTLNVQFNGSIDEALDAYCAQLQWQDTNPSYPPVLMTHEQMRDRFFPYFQGWIDMLLGQKGPNLPVTKHRMVAAVIGAAFRVGINPQQFSEQRWTNAVEFIRRPVDMARTLGCDWPVSRGKWVGPKGYGAQMKAAYSVLSKIAQ